ncbi:MAG TPA: Hpt domain-containing protein [Novosphingobium sp.]|nr:Hpt domain-containing protein [Novosphingobium sp.]
MTHDAGSLDATIAAAAGTDAELYRELRCAFRQSLARHIDLLARARCDGNWQVAAQRIDGLAASFHAHALVALAQQAMAAAPGDPVAVRRLRAFLDDFPEI